MEANIKQAKDKNEDQNVSLRRLTISTENED